MRMKSKKTKPVRRGNNQRALRAPSGKSRKRRVEQNYFTGGKQM